MDCEGINQIVTSLNDIKQSLDWVIVFLIMILVTQCGCRYM